MKDVNSPSHVIALEIYEYKWYHRLIFQFSVCYSQLKINKDTLISINLIILFGQDWPRYFYMSVEMYTHAQEQKCIYK